MKKRKVNALLANCIISDDAGGSYRLWKRAAA